MRGGIVILKINFYYVGGSRLPLRAPHIFGVKTKQKKLNNFKTIKVMKISVGKNGDVNHSAMTAAQIEAALNKSVNIVLSLGDNVQLDANERTIPANMMTGQPAQPVIMLTATDITIEGLEGARTVNVTRILSQACPGCNDLKACAKYLNEKNVTTITVDIETLTNFNNAKRFSNIRLS